MREFQITASSKHGVSYQMHESYTSASIDGNEPIPHLSLRAPCRSSRHSSSTSCDRLSRCVVHDLCGPRFQQQRPMQWLRSTDILRNRACGKDRAIYPPLSLNQKALEAKKRFFATCSGRLVRSWLVSSLEHSYLF